MVLEGDVTSETDILIEGTVRGNIVCQSDIELGGDVTGDVTGKNIRIVQGTVRSNVFCEECLTAQGGIVIGNITARTARIATRIEGDIIVSGTLSLLRESDIQGNIIAGSLCIEEGAVLSGQVIISRDQEIVLQPPCSKNTDRTPSPLNNDTQPVVSQFSSKTESAEVGALIPPVEIKNDEERLSLDKEIVAIAEDAGVISVSQETKSVESNVKKTIAVIGIVFWAWLLLRSVIVDACKMIISSGR